MRVRAASRSTTTAWSGSPSSTPARSAVRSEDRSASRNCSCRGRVRTPYALGVDHDKMIWYSSEWQDTLGRLDPATGEVTEYPIPHRKIPCATSSSTTKGRMWFGSPVNDRWGISIWRSEGADLGAAAADAAPSPAGRGSAERGIQRGRNGVGAPYREAPSPLTGPSRLRGR